MFKNKKRVWNKRGENIALEELVFIVFIVLFATMVFLRVQHVTNSAVVAEELYAKKIALMIDSARPGTTFTFDFSDKIKKPVNIYISHKEKYVEVNIEGEREGYRYGYFNDVVANYSIVNNKLTLDILK